MVELEVKERKKRRKERRFLFYFNLSFVSIFRCFAKTGDDDDV